MSKYSHITVYTDGSCLGNPGYGGWAIVFVADDNTEIETICDSSKNITTNNIMELTAAIMGLQYCVTGKRFAAETVTIHTDSNYVKKGITEWITKWKKNNWTTVNKTLVKNRDLWEKLSFLDNSLNVDWQWVKAHANNKFNNKADKCAREMAKATQPLWQ
ncbi:Ribonuclease H [Candidatus Xenohaliotis californiensis]|uniref:Ribonuclease H n=1 Tax=Candidatus Xenohaliotis californiensis TaxID=84677 RepID=A0ABP0EU24_9RICK|nr:Ribonuclease H [Candidatus Xenohaliotis californiensis]